jgi:hypothetical protein
MPASGVVLGDDLSCPLGVSRRRREADGSHAAATRLQGQRNKGSARPGMSRRAEQARPAHERACLRPPEGARPTPYVRARSVRRMRPSRVPTAIRYREPHGRPGGGKRLGQGIRRVCSLSMVRTRRGPSRVATLAIPVPPGASSLTPHDGIPRGKPKQSEDDNGQRQHEADNQRRRQPVYPSRLAVALGRRLFGAINHARPP